MKKAFGTLLFLIFSVFGHAQTVYDVLDFGARGDGTTDDAPALQAAINKCSREGGGRVLLSRGHEYLSGPLELKSNVELYLDPTAVLRANPDESIYQLSAFRENRGEGMLWIWANDADNIAITGRGTIHGNGIRFMGAELDDSYELKPLKAVANSQLSTLNS